MYKEIGNSLYGSVVSLGPGPAGGISNNKKFDIKKQQKTTKNNKKQQNNRKRKQPQA
jgi:hypothetical protein